MMAITPLEKQARRIKRALRDAGISRDRIERSEDPGRLLEELEFKQQLRNRIADRIEIWIADGLIDRRQAAAMTDDEREKFYFRQLALDRYERSKTRTARAGRRNTQDET